MAFMGDVIAEYERKQNMTPEELKQENLRNADPYVTLGNLAREKYQKFKEKGIPLENKHIDDVQREGYQDKIDEASAQGRNAAIQSLGPVKTAGGVGPHQMIRALDNRRTVLGGSAAQAANAGASAQRTNALQQKVGLVQLGRGIQKTGSSLMTNATTMDIGRRIAERNAAAAVKGARAGAIGTVAGTVAGVGLHKYGAKQDWW